MPLSKQLKADAVLLLVTLSWGVSYLLVDYCMSVMGPLTVNALRFLIAALGIAAVSLPRLRGMTRETRRYALGVGALLAMAYVCVSEGLLYTSMSNAAFLCALPVVLTPVAGLVIYRSRPTRRLLLVLALAFSGVCLMTLTESLRLRAGDLLSFGCAAFYTGDLLLTERAVKRPRVDPFQLGVVHLLVAGVINLVFALLFERPLALPQSPSMWGALLFLAVFCTGIAFVAQPIAQQYTTSAHVGVIFALEPVFAGIAAFFIAGERLTARGYAGALLLLGAMAVMELPMPRRKEKPDNGHSDLRKE